MITPQITLILPFVLWTLLEGFKDSHLFHYKSIAAQKIIVPHYLFTLHRIVTGGLVAWITKDWMFCLGLAMCFTFVHNGIYYHVRHKLNPFIYPLGWKDNSNSSTAGENLPKWLRFISPIIIFFSKQSFFVRASSAMIGFVLLVVSTVLSAQIAIPLP